VAGSIPPDFVREIVDVSEIVSLIESYLPLRKKERIIGGYALSAMMVITLLLVLVNKSNSITVLNVERLEM
jgi:hypothetical protein